VDKTGKNVFVANYDGGSIAVLPIAPDGKLGEATAAIQHHGSSVNKERQQEPHAHCIQPSPDNRFALVADLGLDEVLVYHFDPTKGTLTPNDPPFGKTPPGAGPRHFAFSPNGRFVYVINEIQCTASTFAYDAKRGALRLKDTISTLPDGYKVTNDDSTAELRIHPSGKFVYGSNRGHDSIAVFAVDAAEGTLSPVERVSTQGKTPRGFNIDPTGSYLIAGNQDSDSLVVFQIDHNTGKLTPGQKIEAFAPVDVEFLPLK
jgi:6-phosphogluconolactonase